MKFLYFCIQRDIKWPSINFCNRTVVILHGLILEIRCLVIAISEILKLIISQAWNIVKVSAPSFWKAALNANFYCKRERERENFKFNVKRNALFKWKKNDFKVEIQLRWKEISIKFQLALLHEESFFSPRKTGRQKTSSLQTLSKIELFS